MHLFLCTTITYSQSEFITTWKTDNPGVSEDNQIIIPTYFGNITEFTVAWGDGSETVYTSSANITHTYFNPGTYIVEITGDFLGLYFNDSGDKEKIISIDQWGEIEWASTQTAFRGCSNLDVLATDSPNLSQVTSMNQMFFECSSLIGNSSFNNWDTSSVTSMDSTFAYCTLFNQPIGNWNVENVTNLGGTFLGCSSFNQYIGDWNVQNVESLVFTFGEATSFNQDIGNWNVSSVVSMFWTFMNASSFNQDISNWDVSSVTDLNGMFMGATIFNQPIGNWNISNVTRTSSLFSEAQSFNQSLENWDMSNVTDTSYMFYYAYAFNQDISAWNVSAVTNMTAMFNGATTFNLPIDSWDVSAVTDMTRMFQYAYSFNQNLSNWDVSNVIDMSSLFELAYSFNQNIGNWDVGNVVNMFRTFSDATLFNQPIGSWNVSNVTNMEMMFWNTINFNHPLNNWNVSNVTTMKEMFAGSSNFNQELNNWDVSNVIIMKGMFSGASMFNKNLASWNTSSVEDMNGMFFEADSFNQPIGDWDISSVKNLRAMFFGADVFNQNIGDWNVTNVTDMSSMFERAISFSQNLGDWDIRQAITLENMFNDAGISQENYDATLLGWANLPLIQENVLFNAGNSTFCSGESAKLKLINDYSWVIIDSGKANCPFITTWKTDNPGISEDNQITIPTFPGEIYDYTVNWGDGNIESNFTGDAIHTYVSAGIYQVSISGEFPRIYFHDYYANQADNDSDKIIEIKQWGSINWSSMETAFTGCLNLDISTQDIPDLSQVSSLAAMFVDCTNLEFNESINKWDISNITNLGTMFYNAKLFNQPLDSWDTHNVTNMTALFADTEYFNQSINTWNTENVQNMGGMFARTKEFNQPLDNWNTSNVNDMSGMFSTTFSFDQPLINWDVSNVTNMLGMFETSVFNQDIGSWNVSNVTNMLQMFYQASNFNQDIGSWDVSNVENMLSMFSFAYDFNQNLSEWDVSNVNNMGAMFFDAKSFNQNIGVWDISNVNSMINMLYDSGISIENFDKILIGWSNLSSLQSNVDFSANIIQYCEAEEARQFIIDTYGWTITDGGKVPFCNEDNDLDGILDHLDTCLDTKPNVTVNDYGCEIIANNAISVLGSTPTCPGESNGAIEITSDLIDYSFDISIEGPVELSYSDITSNENLVISNLGVGLYTINVSMPDIGFSQTYGIQINEVGSISGKRESLNTKAKTASYNVVGSYNYKVNVNGKIINHQFSSKGLNTIQLTNLEASNAIVISGESDCQGKITDTFAFSDGVTIYPTVTDNQIYIQGHNAESTLLIYDISGRLVLQKNLSNINTEEINLTGLKPGLYPVIIQSDTNSKTFKIIKK